MNECFDNSLFRPDELKIYPMVVTDMAELTDVWKQGWFEAYNDDTLIDLMCELELIVPEYVRINRTYRDIPANEILHGSTLSNLRQLVEDKIAAQWKKLTDIRSREIKDKSNDPTKAVLREYRYEASGGIEYFLTYEDPEDRTIFSLLRLRIPSSIVSPNSEQVYAMKTDAAKSQSENKDPNRILKSSITEYLPELKWAALIREIHTFWDQLSIGEKWKKFGQHIGFGKRLIARAEEITATHDGVSKVAVISWVGVRWYYQKRGYWLQWSYMLKQI